VVRQVQALFRLRGQVKKGSVNSNVLFLSSIPIQQMRQIGARGHAQMFRNPCQRGFVLFRFENSSIARFII
jgi:hypothetical protein